jgi:protoporphyrinogen oxidase
MQPWRLQIGGGVSGVATAKNALQEGLTVKLIEAQPHVGGLWQFTKTGYAVHAFIGAWDARRGLTDGFRAAMAS